MLRFLSIVSLASAFAFSPVYARTCGVASFYGTEFHGQLTANGERFNAHGRTLASRSLPFGAKVKVTNPATGKSVVARSNDRGPFVPGRILDLSYATFAAIADPAQGLVRVCYRLV